MRITNEKISTSSTLSSITLDEDVLLQQNSLSTEATTTNGTMIDDDIFDNFNKEQREKKTLHLINTAIEQRNLKICKPRFFARPKPQKQIEEGKSLRLKAAISANPTPQVFWYKNGIRLETGNKYSIFQNGDFFLLEVHSLSIFDSGLYKCTAKNTEGISFCSANVKVIEIKSINEKIESPISQRMKRQKSRSEQMAPEIVEGLPFEVKAISGDQFIAECRVIGNPIPSICWLHNNKRITPNSDHIILSFDGELSKLFFSKISSHDSGCYIFFAANPSGTVRSEMNLLVNKTIIKIAPKFFESKMRIRHQIDGKDNGIRQRKIILLAEIIEGTEPITFKWFTPNRVEITNEYLNAYRFDRVGKDSRLTIFDAFPTDSGDYKCLAENKFGTSKCIFELKITENHYNIKLKPPIVSPKQSIIYSKKGQRFVDLIFSVFGDETVICWYRIIKNYEKHIIPNTKKYEANNKENGQYVSLRIYDIQINDASLYKIVAINRCGESSGLIKLVVNNENKTESAL
ncbi:hypothetical protein ACQ4LE_001898 [Meloidogyne hapla]